MVSCRGKPLTPEIKKLAVSVKQYFDRKKLTPAEPSVKRTADALSIGIATVKRIMADYNRDPGLLDKTAKLRGRPIYAVSGSYQESTRSYIRAANKKGEYMKEKWGQVNYVKVRCMTSQDYGKEDIEFPCQIHWIGNDRVMSGALLSAFGYYP